MIEVNVVCGGLHRLARSLERHGPAFDAQRLPSDGLYLFFEEDEQAHGGERIVRVGSHNGHAQLAPRLRQHLQHERKDRSIFRKNIGRALLQRSEDPYAETWEADLTSRAARERPPAGYDERRQKDIESAVSRRIQAHFTFAVLPVPRREDRRDLERKIGSLLFACSECRPSADWLGLHSPKKMIRESGLWQVNGLTDGPLSAEELVELTWLCARGSPLPERPPI